ncbi:MAG: M60 family metallopeptidase [Bacteroidaceae bacterium]|nr:M60 family metallopeptidase [Bacteroidaceae bacterium]
MKLFTQWRFILLSALFSLLGMGSAWAQFKDGGVYYFESAYLEGQSLTSATANKLTSVTTDPSDLNQLWVANEVSTGSGGFTLRNLGNGQYMKSTNSNSGSSYWHTVETADANCQFSCTGPDANNGTYAMRATNTDHAQHFMHAPDASKVVGWAETSAASRWYIRDVSGALSNLFSDAACTTLKKEFADEAALTADIDYLKLPETLRNMVKKVYNQSWAENNYDSNKSAWDNDYAKKYRVQWYEPYTEPECAASALRINAHTNLNNPTGIFANNGDVLFLMVEGEIKEGAYLYLAKYTGHGKLSGYKDGVQLHSGLNIVPVTEDSANFCITYVVQTFDTSKGTGKKAIIQGRELSNYPDLQIHIEGGYINGYWNKMGDNASHNGDFNYPADKDADWDYIKARATQTDVTVLGEYVTLQFPLTDEGTGDDKGMASFFNSYNNGTTTIKTSLEATTTEWDNVMIWERLLMGVVGQDIIEKVDVKSPYSNEPKVTAYTGDDGDDFGCDYSEYYRVHGLSFGTEGGYMYGGWDHCGYNFNTMSSIMVSMVNDAGPHWGPAHEIGHQHQGPLNMRGLTEVTNNLFSNVVLWYYGKSTSRYNGDEGSLTNVLQQFNGEGTDFFSNNIWAQTIMYYKLFLYYHVLGHNPKFYPRLFEMLRQNPMTIAYDQDGGACLMHFYKLCCEAAGEDLTEFFRAHGFFRVMENRFVGDYSNAVYNMTQAQIDQAINDVKAKEYPENLSVLFINDATGGQILSHRNDLEYLAHYGETTICSEIGSYASFATAATPSYNYTVSGNSVTMEGEGGVGFAILNENGELIGFSDKKTFEISEETMEALSNGEVQIVMIPQSGAPIEATSTLSESEIARTLLEELVEQAEALSALTDDEGKKVGFYKSTYTTDLSEALTMAQGVLDNKEVSAYTPAFNALKYAMDDLKSKEFAKITMKPGTYTVRNLAYTTRYLSVNGSNEVVTSTNAEPTETEKWVFEQGDGNNVYYIKNLSTNKYVNALAQSTVVSATTSEIADAKGWLVEDLGNGVFGITCQDENNQAMHSAANASYKIVGWNTGATASRWYLTALETEQLSAEQQALEELIVLSEDMLERVANVETTTEGFSLTEDNYYCNAPMMANWYGDKFEGYHVLFDKDYSTYLHTDYTGADSEDGLDHYLRVDLGDGNSASLFTFNYATRNSSNQNPTAITVEGCNEENGTYELITKLTRDADKLISGANNEYYSAVMGLSSKSYRFLRFMVTGTIQGSTAGPSDDTETPDVNEENKHVFFVFSEFGVSKATCNVTALTKYSTLTNDDVTAAFNAIREAKFAYANATQAADYTTAYNALKDDYDKLVEAYNTGDQTALEAKKEKLQELIDNTTALIAECGNVDYTPETENAIDLKYDATTNYPYLSCSNLYGATGTTNGDDNDYNCEQLLDKDPETYIHTDYNAAESTFPHYLQVDFGTTEAAPALFKFNYATRHNGANQVPREIVVMGSNDGEKWIELATFSSLPSEMLKTWAAEKAIEGGYQYLRFYVTKSAQPEKTPYFVMAEFGLSEVVPALYDITINTGAIQANEDMLLATYKENEEAKSTLTCATTEEQVIKAIQDLQAQYDALMGSIVETAQAFLDSTPTTVGYPSATERETLQTAITSKESVTAINDAVTAFKCADDIVMPESGKAYKIYAWWRKKQWPLTFIAEGQGSYACKKPAYAPVENAEAAVFVCRDLGNGEYAFVTNNGYYLGWQSDTKTNKTAMDFTVGGVKNAFKVSKSVPNANGANLLGVAELFGTVNLCGHHDNNNSWWHYMFSSSTTEFHDAGAGATYYGDNAQTIYYKFEEVDYTLNTIKMNALGDDDHQLLTGLETGMSMSTFSAPYPTVTPEGITAYYAKDISTTAEDGESKDVAVLQKMRTAIPANQGVVLVGDKGVSGNFKMLPAAGEDVPADLDNNKLFKGTGDEPKKMSMDGTVDYILGRGTKGVGFYKAKAGSTLAAGKAYFHFENQAQVRNFVLRFGGETTDIEDAVLAPATDNDAIYDLSGRRVLEITKGGIYIKNGKKFIVK